jgi:hypothetical protein
VADPPGHGTPEPAAQRRRPVRWAERRRARAVRGSAAGIGARTGGGIPRLEAAIRDDRYPLLWKVSAAGVFDQSEDANFEFGLQPVLDGIQALVEARATSAR